MRMEVGRTFSLILKARMSSMSCLWLVLVLQSVVLQCAYGQYDWQGGDWVMENLKGTKEPFGVPGEWADYVNTLAGPYDEIPDTPPSKVFVTSKSRGPKEWYPLSNDEIPYLAVLYRKDKGPSSSYKSYFEGELDPGASHVEPGTACGGALVSPSYVLTVCGCLVSFIADVHGVPFEEADRDVYEEDILDRTGPFKNHTVYMAHTAVQFKPDFSYEIDHNRDRWPRDRLLNCVDLLSKLQDKNWNEGVQDDAKKLRLVNSQFVLAPFTPEVKPEHPNFYPKWPPHPVNDGVDPTLKERVNVISIGMVFSKAPNIVFYSSTSASSLEMKHCNPEFSSTCNYTKIARGPDFTCFCPVGPTYNLYGGTIGWPVVQQAELVGLTATGRDSINGFLAAAILSDEFNKNVENFMGKKTLLEQNTVPPVYRQEDLKNKYFIYDYDKFGSRQQVPYSSDASAKRPLELAVAVLVCMVLYV